MFSIKTADSTQWSPDPFESERVGSGHERLVVRRLAVWVSNTPCNVIWYASAYTTAARRGRHLLVMPLLQQGGADFMSVTL